MLPRGMRDKLKVDPEDQVMNVCSYYKSTDFDALVPISVFVKGQPAVDAGGVLRQVFGTVFVSLCNNEDIKLIFTGEPYRKLPVFSDELVVNGFSEILGKMISYSLVQGGPGFPYLSPSIYWFLATRDLQTALAKASCADVQNNELIKYIDKVNKFKCTLYYQSTSYMYVLKDRTEILKFCHRMLTVFLWKQLKLFVFPLPVLLFMLRKSSSQFVFFGCDVQQETNWEFMMYMRCYIGHGKIAK